MFVGRVVGWFLVVVAALTASAEVVVALGTGEYDCIATHDLWTLITGRSPGLAAPAVHWSDVLVSALLSCPAWTVIAALGIGLIFACRPRRRRSGYRQASMWFSTTLH